MASLDKESWSAVDPPPSLQPLVDFFEAHTRTAAAVPMAAGAAGASGRQGVRPSQDLGAAQMNGSVAHERREEDERSGSDKDGERRESMGEGRDGGASDQVGGSVQLRSEGEGSGSKADERSGSGRVQEGGAREQGQTNDGGDVKAGEGEREGDGGGGGGTGGGGPSASAADSPSSGSKGPKKGAVGTVLCHGSKYHVAGW